ncbi:hypothetical protein RhiXN_08455 [Rhizoctonia solani]|uniref:Uncharacterized protein n=1 Tax=Rhizoctonia solani TaxID=456999 RepID=A0A8H8P0R4_9AGAM|nr:uncharacterized protein RhiXN_08455 [Rhizoctonia solani]QRW23419.1 hypothetical protein RhiXN_08455 [Rhizoctonia solani]
MSRLVAQHRLGDPTVSFTTILDHYLGRTSPLCLSPRVDNTLEPFSHLNLTRIITCLYGNLGPRYLGFSIITPVHRNDETSNRAEWTVGCLAYQSPSCDSAA